MKTRSLKYFLLLFFFPTVVEAENHSGLSGLFGTWTTPQDAVLNAFQALAPVFATVSVIMIIYGGFLYMTSNGDPKRAAKGREYIIYVLIGVAIYVGANFILTAVGAQGL